MPFHLRKSSLLLLLGLLLAPSLAGRAAQVKHPIYYQDIDHVEPAPELYEHEVETFIKQQQAKLDDKGVHLFASYWGDFLANPIGGEKQASAWTQLLIVGAEIDLQKTIGGPSGGSIVASFADGAGSNLSVDIGNAFAVPQAYLMNTFALYDLYYKQRLFEDRITFEIGRMTAGQFFATLPAMTMVVSAAVNGNPTSLYVNALFPSISCGTWGAHLKVKPTEQTYVEAGAFQASARNGMALYHGADFSIRPNDGILLMAELGWTPNFEVGESIPADGKAAKPEKLKLPGLYTFGTYLTSYTFSTFQGGAEHNAYGFYWLNQQMIWRSRHNPLHNVSLWGGVTYSPQEQISLIPVMGIGGLIFQGFIPTRDADSALLSFYTGRFSRTLGDGLAAANLARPTTETVVEASYIIQLTQSLQFQPDLQYIIRPGGTGAISNALVVGFQVNASF